MEWSQVAIASVFAGVGLACLLAIPIGLPGSWILLAVAALLELAHPTFGWRAIAAAAGLAVVGEAIEAAAGVLGAKWGGATRRGMIGAFAGGIAGAVLGSPLIPIPLVGTLIGALLGTFAGALYAEWTAERRRSRDANVRAAWSALLGRLAGTLGKLGFGIAAFAVLLTAAFARAG
jgi:uncharacterized protein YqgC (DUF456 family)